MDESKSCPSSKEDDHQKISIEEVEHGKEEPCPKDKKKSSQFGLNRKPSADKHVRFYEKDNKLELKIVDVKDADLGLQSAESRETKVVWETIPSPRPSGEFTHKISTDSSDSVFDHRSYDDDRNSWDGQLVTDLDEEECPIGALKHGNIYKSLLEERRNQKVSTSDFLGDGGYSSLEVGAQGGSAHVPHSQTHTCGSLFAQCGAHRQHSLVTTFSQPSGYLEREETDSAYSGPVSLTEILQERQGERMCVTDELRVNKHMGNGVSSQQKGEKTTLCPSNPDPQVTSGVVNLLKKEIRQWEDKATELNEEVATLRREAKRKDHEILRLQREVHKLKVRTSHKQVTNAWEWASSIENLHHNYCFTLG